MNELISLEWLWGVLGAAGALIVRIIFDRRKFNAENRQEEAKAKETEIDVDIKAVDLYERYASQAEARLKGIEEAYEKMFNELQMLRRENSDLKFDNNELKRENEVLREENHKLSKSIEEALNEIDKLKKQLA